MADGARVAAAVARKVDVAVRSQRNCSNQRMRVVIRMGKARGSGMQLSQLESETIGPPAGHGHISLAPTRLCRFETHVVITLLPLSAQIGRGSTSLAHYGRWQGEHSRLM